MRKLLILLATGSLLLGAGLSPAAAAVKDDDQAPACCRRQSQGSGCCGRCGQGSGPQGPQARCGAGQGAGMGMGYRYRGGRGPGAAGPQGSGRAVPGMRGPGMGGPGMAEAHGPIHALLDESGKICREVRDIDGGVYAKTVSDDPDVADQIKTHVAQMKQRLESGAGLRYWDPLFVELFRNHDRITLQVREIADGVEIWETSDDPEVTALIRQHARRAVSEFVDQGYDRVHQPTPLPGTDAP